MAHGNRCDERWQEKSCSDRAAACRPAPDRNRIPLESGPRLGRFEPLYLALLVCARTGEGPQMAPTEASAQLVRQGTTTERYAVTTARWRDRPRTARSMVGGPMGSPGRARRRTRSTVGYGSGSPNGAIPGSPRGAHAPSAYSGTETADRFHQNVATLSQIAIMAIWGAS